MGEGRRMTKFREGETVIFTGQHTNSNGTISDYAKGSWIAGTKCIIRKIEGDGTMMLSDGNWMYEDCFKKLNDYGCKSNCKDCSGRCGLWERE
jgi:hypothetical protein